MTDTQSANLFDEMLKASSDVDFDHIQEAIGYATLIFTIANQLGILFPMSNLQSYEAKKTTQLAKDWVYNIKTRIGGMTAGDAMDILGSYDFMHRIGHHSPIPKTFADEYLIKAFEARIHGDKTVNEYHLYSFIKNELERKNKLYFDRPLKWYSSSLDRWHKKFRYGSAFEDSSDYDTLEIVSILMSEDLFVFVDGNQDKFKKELFDNHRHYFNKIDDLGFKELDALMHFLSRSYKFMPPEQYQEYDNAITLGLIARPETNRYYRLTLQRNLALLNED